MWLATGEVFVYTMKVSTGEWAISQILTGPENQFMGYSVALDGDLALIGTPRMSK